MNEFYALAPNLSRAAVFLIVFAATAALILAGIVILFYFLGLLDLLRGGFLYARRAHPGSADPLQCLGKPLLDVNPGAFGNHPQDCSSSQAGQTGKSRTKTTVMRWAP